MSTVDVAKILQPVPGDFPCGADLEYDTKFLALFQAAMPKPARQVGAQEVPAEEPDWRAVKANALELLGRSKDLRVLVLLIRALVYTDGLAGFIDGVRALRGLITTHWADLFPRLDAEDGNDPAMRVNAMASLTDGTGLVRSLREWPLLRARVAGVFGLRELDAATGRVPAWPHAGPAGPVGRERRRACEAGEDSGHAASSSSACSG
jgi:type VI secretion system protein ImpA